jgi:hypothetical protein
MTTRSRAKNNVIAECLAAIAGLQKHLAGKTLILGGVSIAVDDIIAALTNYIALLTAASASKAAWQQDVQAARTAEASQIGPMRADLSSYLEGMYGASAGILLDFGLTPKKKAQRTVKTKAEGVAKDLATRDARDTMGPREKEAIHGTVPPAAPTPSESPAAPATPAAPTSNAPQTVRPGDGVKPR